MDFPEELKSKLKETPPEVIEYIIHLHEKIEKQSLELKNFPDSILIVETA